MLGLVRKARLLSWDQITSDSDSCQTLVSLNHNLNGRFVTGNSTCDESLCPNRLAPSTRGVKSWEITVSKTSFYALWQKYQNNCLMYLWTKWPNFPTRYIKVSSKNQHKINLLPVMGYIKAASRTLLESRVKFGSLDHGNSAGHSTSLFKSSLSFNSHSASRAAKTSKWNHFSPGPSGAL